MHCNVSTCRSPQQMFGSLVKTYYAEKAGIDPEDIFVVSIMPCTAKKYEVQREEQRLPNGCMPVDVSAAVGHFLVLLVQRRRAQGLQVHKVPHVRVLDGLSAAVDAPAGTGHNLLFDHLPDGQFDELLGVSTGAATIFGASGGVMEAALRTVVEQLTGKGAAWDFRGCGGRAFPRPACTAPPHAGPSGRYTASCT